MRRCRLRSISIIRSTKSSDSSQTAIRLWPPVLLALLCGISFLSGASAENGPSATESKQGSLVIIGGSERFNQREYWDEIVELAGGPGSRIAVFPTASGDPVKKGGWVISALNKSGADAFLVPVAWRKVPIAPQDAVSDPDLVAQVREATGIFLIGGEQDKIVKALYTPSGQHTPMLDAMWEVYRKGGVIAGTSAGAAVMSRVMYRDAESVLGTMQNGVRWGEEIDRGLGFIDDEWFVDQHLFVRGRFARTLVAMEDQGFKYGIGVDENSAIIVTNGKDVRVIGYKGALVLDLSRAERDPSQPRFNLKNARLTYLDRGDRFDLKTREVMPAQEKLDDEKLDPNSPDFRPALRRPLFATDILSNTTVIDLMGNLMETVSPVAIGLAFDGHAAKKQPVDGFEFKFTRDEETVAWYTEIYGGDDFTVVNMRLDIRPIKITGPLYDRED
ncbi:cyanophycinase [Schlesneria paludicola]|uniref:cyanophycinase n=1 Tax=Schlesneria paludicola TaxID=360056 RepID=UPI00029A44B5|nr:cyanophycinase [Schlesneria paludicola]